MSIKPDPTTVQLASRLAKLERNYARLKWTFAVGLLSIFALYPAVESLSNPKIQNPVIHASSFVVDGPNGHPYAKLDSYGLHLYSEKGVNVVNLTATTKATELSLCEWNKVLLAKKTTPNRNQPCPPRLRLVTPELQFFNKSGVVTASLVGENNSETQPNHSYLRLTGGPGGFHHHPSIYLSPEMLDLSGRKSHINVSDGEISLTGRGNNETAILLSLGHDFAKPAIELNDSHGTPRAIVGAVQLTNKRTREGYNRPASSLLLLDKKANVIWSAPTN